MEPKVKALILVIFQLIFLISCYEAKNEVPLQRQPIFSLLLNVTLYPINYNTFSNLINLSSKNLPGTIVYVKKIGSTYFVLIEKINNVNLLELYVSTNGIDFENTNQIIDSTNFSTNGKRFLFSYNNEIIYMLLYNLFNNNSYKYYSYVNGILSLNNFTPTQGVGQPRIFECIYTYNSELRAVISINDLATSTYTGNTFSITNSFQTYTNLSSSPGYTTPRTSASCSIVDSTIYLYGGYRTNCSTGSICNYTDLYSSQDGVSFNKINSDFQSNLSGNDRIIKLGDNSLLFIPSFFSGYQSKDSGSSWSLVSFSAGSSVAVPNLIGVASSGNTVFIYSPTKVYYGVVP